MDGQVVIGTKLDTKDFDAEIQYIENQLEEIEDKLKKADMGFEVGDTAKLEAQYSRLSKQLDKLIIKNEKLNKANFSIMESSLDNVGNSITKIIKKVARWGLAVFGIRSAYLAVRSAMNTITQYDAQLKADIDYMKNAIAFALEPVVRKIVELAQKLMFYIAYIIKAWTGRDIFANANKSLKQANGEAKKLSKTLAGFDEMNVLNDSSSGGGGGVATPSFDLTAPEDIQPPSWLVWIADNKEIVIAGLLGIAGALIAVKLGISGIMGLGIGIAIAGIIMLIKDVIKFIKDPSWGNFINVLNSLSIALIGVGIAMVAFNASNPIGWIMLAIGAIGLLVTAVVKNWGKIKETLSNAWQWIKTSFNKLPSWAKSLLKGIGNAVINVINHIIDKLNAFLLPLRSVITAVGKVTGKNWNLGNIAIPRVPYLAKGGIVNMPGKGVPIGGAIAGESGREAVLPLQDSQVLQEIADAIGRRITINANIVNSMNGRVISKELQKIQTEENFAFNR